MSKILLIDDMREIHDLMQVSLRDPALKLVDAFNGDEAMKVLHADAAEKGHPNKADVILLDIEMPDINGIDLCKKIRSIQGYEQTPIIFLSSHNEPEIQAHAFDAGANNYLTKPFSPALVLAAVQSAAKAQHLIDETDELIEHKTALTNMLVHDINNYLATMMMNLELTAMSKPEKVAERLTVLTRNVSEVKKLTRALLDIEKLESKTLPIRREKFDAWKVFLEHAESTIKSAEKRRLKLNVLSPAAGVPVTADLELLTRTFDNLLQNAAKFAPEETTVEIGVRSSSSGCELTHELTVENDGPAIEEQFHHKIFEKFGQLECHDALPSKGVGLGLTFCRLALEAMGGKITVESPIHQTAEGPRGVRFVVKLP